MSARTTNVLASLLAIIGLSCLMAAGAQLALQAIAEPAVPVAVVVDRPVAELPPFETLEISSSYRTRAA